MRPPASLLTKLPRLILPLMLAMGCGDPNGFDAGCQSQVTFAVSGGLTPQIRWAPDCKLGIVSVAAYPGMSLALGQRVDGASWIIKTSDQFGADNLLEPSLHYGSPPSEATTVVGPKPLVAGVQYVVQGWVVDLHGQATGAGTTPFRP